jgi:hypothetical protein
VVAVREALKRLGCTAELLRLPNRRLSVSLAQDQIDIALLFGITAERMRDLRFPLDAKGRPDVAWAPVFGHLALFGRGDIGMEPGWDGRRLPPGLRVGVLAGSVQEAIARERGWTVELVNLLDSEFTMLQARRFDLLLTPRNPQRRAARRLRRMDAGGGKAALFRAGLSAARARPSRLGAQFLARALSGRAAAGARDPAGRVRAGSHRGLAEDS